MSTQLTNSPETVNSVFSSLDAKKGQIRVAVIHPLRNTDPCVHVELKVTSVRGKLQYDALSWAWGDANDVKSIVLQGQLWWTPRNLVTALEHLAPADQPRIIWIDALCINQSHTPTALAERQYQVGLMRYIYTSADHVLVWMGQEREYSAGVLSFINEVADQAQFDPDQSDPPILPHSFRISYEDSSKVLRLLSEPWWDRLWVLQEVGLAKSPILCYGNTSIEFKKALFAINLMKYRGHLWNTDAEFEAKVGPFNSNELYGFDFMHRYNNPTVMAFTPRKQHFRSLAMLLVACRFRLATDLHDKIYGLLGLVPELVLEALQPRYDEPVEKTYIRTAFMLMGESQSLLLLSHTTPWLRGHTGTVNLPSWVPDWSVQNEPRYWQNVPDHMSDTPRYIGSQIGTSIRMEVIEEKSLKLQGVLIDTIKKTGHGHRGFLRFMDWSKHRRKISELYTDDSGDDLENDIEHLRESHWDDLWQILTLMYLGMLLDMASLKFFAFLRWIASQNSQFYDFITRSSNESDTKRRTAEERDFTVMRSSKHMAPYLKDRPHELSPSSILTTEDNFVGVGPAFTESGDQIFVVAAARYPLIVRKVSKTSSRYIYVGECYLAGVMGGEATKEVFGSWRSRRGVLLAEAERQPNDQAGIWEELVLE